MDTGRVVLVVCVTLFLVIGINAALYVAFTRRSNVNQIDLMRRAAERARRPWQDEDEALSELSRRVKRFKDAQGGEGAGNKEEEG